MKSSWLANTWENLRTSLWFVPFLIVLLHVGLASGTLHADGMLDAARSRAIPYLFSGTADAAGTLLSALASSLLTVLSIAFSLTMVALQQASSQFSPRVLRVITGSRVNQVVVGGYAGTFIYALLVLRTVRGEHARHPFVPALSVSTAVLLAVLCIALLVYFIHHVSLSLQVSEVIARLHANLLAQLAQLYPTRLAEGEGEDEREQPDAEPHTLVRTERGGFVRRVDDGLGALRHPDLTLWLRAQPGDYVPSGGVLAGLSTSDAKLTERVREAFVLDAERSDMQDALFDIRQLVDIGLRALSPGVNDPTTAQYVLLRLGDAMGTLARRGFPRAVRQQPGCVTLIIRAARWSDFVDASFSELRRAAHGQYDVTGCLIRVLREIAELTTQESRAVALRDQLQATREGILAASFLERDRQQLLRAADAALAQLSPGALATRGTAGL